MGKLALGTAIVLALGAGLALGQDGSTGEESTQPAQPMGKAEQVAAAESVVKQGNVLSKRVRELLNEARKENDIIKVTCLNSKLTQINANLRNAQRRLGSLKEAVDADQANHEYTVLTVIGAKFATLDKEASQCVGQDMYDTGQTKVVTEIDTSKLPFEDTPSIPPIILPPTLPTLPPPASGLR